jgi:thymidylate synthase (FAD)
MQILDHGYVKLVEAWGSDERIIESARMSTGKGFLGWGPIHTQACLDADELDRSPAASFICTCPDGPKAGDEKLLRFLWENKHSTPFEMAGMTIEVQAPIFVFREWHRHRVPFGYSEMSARYTPLPDLNYVPTIERLMVNSKTNKQAGTVSGADELTEESAAKYIHELRHVYEVQQVLYEHALKIGVPKELARIHLPVGRYSRMRATSNLRGWLAFLTLRMAPGAQYEIRVYANAVGDLIKQKFPRTWELFAESK